MALEVIGAGFGRTGTMSLKAGLERLGFSKCHHMEEVGKNPESASFWQDASQRKVANEPIDWSVPLGGYKAAVDWPSCAFYKELMDAYPDAKVILTTRDPESWYTSVTGTIYGTNQVEEDAIPPPMRPLFKMVRAVVWKGTFNGKFEDKAYAIDVFNAHIEEVKRVVPAEKLLVYSVKEGWEPLGEFLGVSVPDEPFPHLNEKETFKERLAKRMQASEGR